MRMNSARLGNAVRIVIAPDKFEGSLSAGEAAYEEARLHGFALSNYFATLQEPELRIDIVRPVWLDQMADTERLLAALEAAPMARTESIGAGIAN
jgi:hypothetical protein